MKKPIIVVLLLVFMMLTGSLGVRAENKQGTDKVKPAEPEQKPIKHVVLITMDNVIDEALKNAYTPNINGLAAGGVKTTAIGVLPANSAAFIASLLTGADPSVHGMMNAKMKLKTRSLPQIIRMYGRTSVFVSTAGTTSAAVFESGENTVQDLQVKTTDNGVLIDKAIEIFKQKQPYFIGIRLVGGQGNNKAKEINSTDNEIGRLLAALRRTGVYDQCLIAVTGNYGDIEDQFKESGDTQGLMVPVILKGPGLKSGVVLPPAKITDIAPTIALLTGVQIPPESRGMVLWNALRSGTGFIEENLLLKRVKDLSHANIKSIGDIYRLNEEKGLVKTEKENISREKSIMQKTVDGKNAEIKTLKLKIIFLKFLEVITIAFLGLGYAVEYFYLKKKFLMF